MEPETPSCPHCGAVAVERDGRYWRCDLCGRRWFLPTAGDIRFLKSLRICWNEPPALPPGHPDA